MARRIKRFFVFLFFSLCFSLLSGRIAVPGKSEKKDASISENKATKVTVWSLNSAQAEDNNPYECDAPAD